MKNIRFIQNLFMICLFIVLVISFYFFIDVLVLKNRDNSNIFGTWQFPMLLALFIDSYYGL